MNLAIPLWLSHFSAQNRLKAHAILIHTWPNFQPNKACWIPFFWPNSKLSSPTTKLAKLSSPATKDPAACWPVSPALLAWPSYMGFPSAHARPSSELAFLAHRFSAQPLPDNVTCMPWPFLFSHAPGQLQIVDELSADPLTHARHHLPSTTLLLGHTQKHVTAHHRLTITQVQLPSHLHRPCSHLLTHAEPGSYFTSSCSFPTPSPLLPYASLHPR